MTTIIIHGEVFIDCRQDQQSGECCFQFKAKEFFIKFKYERGMNHFVLRITCEIDQQEFNFGQAYARGRSFEKFGEWPVFRIDNKNYHFKVNWGLDSNLRSFSIVAEESEAQKRQERSQAAEKQVMQDMIKELKQNMEEKEEHTDNNFEQEIDAPSGSRKLRQLINEVRNEFKDLKK
jgi:hypothetical protein